MKVVIPPRKNSKVQREYDKIAYKKRHLVENAFLHIKQWRGVATRYAKRTESFLAAIHIRCLFIWVTREVDSESLKAMADSKMVETVIRNLVSNAVKFTSTGGQVNVDSQKEGNRSGSDKRYGYWDGSK